MAIHPFHRALLQALAQRQPQRFAVGGAVGPTVNYAPTMPQGQQPQQPQQPAPTLAGALQGAGYGTAGGQASMPGQLPALTGQLGTAGVPGIGQVPTSNIQFTPGQFSGSTDQAQGTLSDLTKTLQSQINGGGPNLADAQEQQATQRNLSQAFAMAQANPNNGASLRNISNQLSGINQQAAADSAQQRMQQQLMAQQQLQQLGLGQLGTAGSLMTDQQKLGLQQTQGNQNAALHSFDTLFGTGAKLTGGLLQGAGAVGAMAAQEGIKKAMQDPGAQTAPSQPPLVDAPTDTGAQPAGGDTWEDPYASGQTYAHGGLVGALRYAKGGEVPNDYSLDSQVADAKAPNLLARAIGGAGGSASGVPAGVDPGTLQAWETGASLLPYGGYLVKAEQALRGAGLGTTKRDIWDVLANHNTTDEEKAQKDRLTDSYANTNNPGVWVDNAIADTGNWIGNLFHATGGPVPGRAATAGDSLRNDTVPALLSPGEIVLPRSVTQSAHPADMARAFVQSLGAQRFADGGTVGNLGRQAAAQQAEQDMTAQDQQAAVAPSFAPVGMGDVRAADKGLDTPPPAPQDDGTPALLRAPSNDAPTADGAASPALNALQKFTMAASGRTPGAPVGFAMPQGGKGDRIVAQAYQDKTRAQREQTEVAQKQAEIDADAATQQTQIETDALAAQKARDATYNREYIDGRRNLDDTLAKWQQMSTTVDPSRWYGSRNTGQKILAGVGIALGSLGSALTGGPNEAMQMINNTINNDIEAQKVSIQNEMEKGRGTMDAQKNMLALNREKFKDDVVALEATRMAHLKTVEAQTLATMKRLAANQGVQAAGNMLLANIKDEYGKSQQIADDRLQQRAIQAAQLAVQQHDSQREDAKLAMSWTDAKKAGMNPEAYVPGLGFALDKEAAKTLREKKSAYESADSAVDDLIQLRTKNSAQFTGPEVSQMKAAADRLMFAIQENKGLKRLSDKDIEVLKEMSGGDPTRIGYVLPALKDLKTSMGRDFMALAKNHLTPGTSPLLEGAGQGGYRARTPGNG